MNREPRAWFTVIVLLQLVVLFMLTGCVGLGVNAFADFSNQTGGDVVHRIGGEVAPGPQARAGVELDKAVGAGFIVALGVEHRSYPSTTKDRGEERAYVGARYRWEF